MKTPFLLLSLALASGILLSDVFHLHFFPFIGLSAILLCLIITYQYIRAHLSQPLIQTFLLSLLCFSIGISIRSLQVHYKLSDTKEIQKHASLKVVLTEYKGLKDKSKLWRGRCIQGSVSDSYFIHLYLDSSANLHKNDILLIPNKHIEFCTESKNVWMINSNMIAQAFPKYYIKATQPYIPNQIMQWSESLQQYSIKVIHLYLHDQDAAAIAISMILGQRTEISPALQNAYKNTGTIHILAVSGMHVALLHQALIFMTAFSGNHNKMKTTKNIVSLFILWFYALLTGFSASVVRAAAMFSLVLIASSLDKKDNGMNNLSAASFILLCYDSSWLYDFGFLLSVSAVAGIFLFTPKVDTQEPSFIKKFLSNAAGVSIAAQLGTLPVSLYLSRSFPVYFLLANMILIPISSLALYLGLALLLTHHIPLLNTLNGFLLEYTLIIMNYGAVFIAKLPGGLIYLYHFNTRCAAWSAVILFTLALYLHYKYKVLLHSLLISILLFVFYLNLQELKTQSPSRAANKNYYQGQQIISLLKGRTLYIKHKGTEQPPYSWLRRKLNLED